MNKILLMSIAITTLSASSYSQNKLLDQIEVYNRKCQKGDNEACMKINQVLNAIQDKNNPSQVDSSKNQLINQCNSGDFKKCNAVAHYYMFGMNGFETNFDKAYEYYKKACKGIPASCDIANSLKSTYNNSKPNQNYQNNQNYNNYDFSNNIQNYMIECENGNGKICLEIARGYNQGKYGLSKNIDKSIIYAQKACDYKVYEGCSAVNDMTRGVARSCGKHVLPKDAVMSGNTYLLMNKADKARECFMRACDKKYGIGCRKLGDLYHYGTGAVYDYKTAKVYYAKGCEFGDVQACEGYKIVDRKMKKDENNQYITIERK